jgi:5'-nucleotidase
MFLGLTLIAGDNVQIDRVFASQTRGDSTPMTEPPAQAKGTKIDFLLTILHNNDGESQLINAGSGLEDFGGVARFKTLVDRLKFEATHGPRGEGEKGAKRGVVMLSSGDNFLAGPEFNASLTNGVFYDAITLNEIGYDAIDLGNHDFDFGPELLAAFINQGFEDPVPYLSANLDFRGEPALQALVDQGRIAKSAVIKERGELIGIVGATTERLASISSPGDVVINAVAPAIQAEVDKLIGMGINKIIVISHLQSIDEDRALAPQLRGVDIMIAGGGDEILANSDDLLVPGDTPVNPYPLFATGADGTNIPIVTTGGNYKYVGRLVAGFDKQGKVLSIVEQGSGPVRVAGGNNPDAVEADSFLQENVVAPVAEYVAELGENVIGASEVNLNGKRGDVRTIETNEGNLIADALFWQATQRAADFGVDPPDIALQNGGGIRNDTVISAGDITELDTFDMLPFSNFVTLVPDISRETFKAIMENAVSRVEFVDGRFAQISGFTMIWSPTAAAGSRVVSIVLDDGTIIVDKGAVVSGDSINIATIDFLANGGDQYPFGSAAYTRLGVSYQRALRNYIVDGLGGVISADDYPESGEGRIIRQ